MAVPQNPPDPIFAQLAAALDQGGELGKARELCDVLGEHLANCLLALDPQVPQQARHEFAIMQALAPVVVTACRQFRNACDATMAAI